MKVKDKLEQEFKAAILAELGDVAEKEFEEVELDAMDVVAIAKKVAFYLGLE